MALIQSTLIWVVYAIVIVLVVAIASVFVYTYQAPRGRSATVTIVCIFTLTALLATVLLLPVDIALVSSTTSSKLGRRKDWATQNRVDNITLTLRIVYYTLYSLDALLCLIVVPFTYFWYEEYDEVATEEGTQTVASRCWGALKYTIAFILLVVILFLVGFFVPVAKDRKGAHYDLDFFKRILHDENRECLLRNEYEWCKADRMSRRWRTSIIICLRTADYHRHLDIYSLYCGRLCSSANRFHQISPRNIGANLKCQYSIRT